MLLFRWSVPLRLVAALTCIVVLIVIALLIDAAATDGEFATAFLPCGNMRWLVWPCAAPPVWHVLLVFDNAKLLLVRFLALHGSYLGCDGRVPPPFFAASWL